MIKVLHLPGFQITIVKFSSEESQDCLRSSSHIPTVEYKWEWGHSSSKVQLGWKKSAIFQNEFHFLFSLKTEFIDQERFQNVFSNTPTWNLDWGFQGITGIKQLAKAWVSRFPKGSKLPQRLITVYCWDLPHFSSVTFSILRRVVPFSWGAWCLSGWMELLPVETMLQEELIKQLQGKPWLFFPSSPSKVN